MRWAGAILALLLCFAVCLLVVAIRVRTVALRARICAVHREALHVEAERDRLVREIAAERRPEVLRARYASYTTHRASQGPAQSRN